jgi:uncharacterized membrane-anchored protein
VARRERTSKSRQSSRPASPLLLITVAAQLASKTFHPFLYWVVIVATTTAGTTMADFADRSLGIGYFGGSLVLLASLMAILACWRFSVGSVSVNRIVSRKEEAFYWVTILFSNTLGIALGDFFADDSGLGYEGAALIFAGLLALFAAAYFRTNISRTVLFWSAFILTRPQRRAVILGSADEDSRSPKTQPSPNLARKNHPNPAATR